MLVQRCASSSFLPLWYFFLFFCPFHLLLSPAVCHDFLARLLIFKAKWSQAGCKIITPALSRKEGAAKDEDILLSREWIPALGQKTHQENLRAEQYILACCFKRDQLIFSKRHVGAHPHLPSQTKATLSRLVSAESRRCQRAPALCTHFASAASLLLEVTGSLEDLDAAGSTNLSWTQDGRALLQKPAVLAAGTARRCRCCS